MSKSKTHRVILTVSFNKKCTAAEARRAVADNIHGEFYPNPERDDGPDKFRVRSVRRALAKAGFAPR